MCIWVERGSPCWVHQAFMWMSGCQWSFPSITIPMIPMSCLFTKWFFRSNLRWSFREHCEHLKWTFLVTAFMSRFIALSCVRILDHVRLRLTNRTRLCAEFMCLRRSCFRPHVSLHKWQQFVLAWHIIASSFSNSSLHSPQLTLELPRLSIAFSVTFSSFLAANFWSL